eukprot:CAMPEP_0202865676 /NCGR_PEP_ID=MMETSP1391-20130828/6291_1 /ASSEMBLY_ACC=CAM_ASM_000867 /TAXON_ID=1034604 /ORGANISM="Chlamydomonas leiostraca, Strain SAG 11-49" /LENGTH=345 /DNA_ID=CAMNT_0049545541 /DNA_START=225 /DNA_END=1263 /DNA_ORIENTATION=+
MQGRDIRATRTCSSVARHGVLQVTKAWRRVACAAKKHKGPGKGSGASVPGLPAAPASPAPLPAAATTKAAAAVAVAVVTTTRQRTKEQQEVVVGGDGASGGSMSEGEGAEAVANNILPTGGLGGGMMAGVLSRHRALVLDSAYRPINVVSWAKAVMMDVSEKADVLEYYPPPARALSGRGEHALPAVVRVHTYIDMSELTQRVSCTRRNVMARDNFSCQYCGCKGGGKDGALTLDHVVPVSRGGKGTWDNLVTACMSCNQKKGSSLLSQLRGWKLRAHPREPKPWEIGMVVGLSSHDLDQPSPLWAPYIEPFRAKVKSLRSAARSAGEVDAGDAAAAAAANAANN